VTGIFGMTCGAGRAICEDAVTRMASHLTHPQWGVPDTVRADDVVAGTRVHAGRLPGPPQPFVAGDLTVWLDGEIVRAAGSERVPPPSDGPGVAALADIFASEDPATALRTADGNFAGAVYDSRTQTIRLVTDGFGLRALYWLEHNGDLVWASGLAALLAVPGFSPRIDRRAVEELMTCGHPIGDRSMFEGVKLLPPATVLTWSRSDGVRLERYWWWGMLRPAGVSRLDEAADELGRRLRHATAVLAPPDERIAVSLSGGLDSRALVASVPPRDRLPVLTFGRTGCVDIAIAAQVAALRGAQHHVVTLTARNWLAPRLAAVWFTDGQFNVMNMHGVEAADVYRGICDAHLDGYGGDFVHGGMYMGDKPSWGRFDRELVASRMKCDPEFLGDLAPWDTLERSDYYLIENRARRMNNAGTRMMQLLGQERKPFLATGLVEFTFGVPDELRARGRLYRRMLVRSFPEYYRHIAWASLGVPVSWPRGVRRLGRNLYKTSRQGEGHMRAYGLPGVYSSRYTDYVAWLASPPALGFVDALLRAPDALYPEYVARDTTLAHWDQVLAGEDQTTEVGRALTLEIWLQQVYAGRWRPGADLPEVLR
jgi:asparagine synthase (glutamine-hydrolysing)